MHVEKFDLRVKASCFIPETWSSYASIIGYIQTLKQNKKGGLNNSHQNVKKKKP